MKLGTTELIIILVVILIIFGPTQIPKLTKMFGKSVKSFKDGIDEAEEDVPAEKKAKKASSSKKAQDSADEEVEEEKEE